MKITDAMKRAYLWLQERGGAGVVDHYGRLVASGDAASHIAPETWLRLVVAGMAIGEECHLVLVDEA